MNESTRSSETVGLMGYIFKNEEFWNVISHGLGFILSIPALILLIVKANELGSALHMVSFIIFGVSMMALYLASTLFHGFSKYKHIFSRLDHASIYILIAGTCTPIALIGVGGKLGWTIFGIEWGLTIFGIIFKYFFIYRFNALSLIIYIAMGWLIVIAYRPLIEKITWAGAIVLLIGGILYTVGTYFYQNNKIPFNHAIWHLFVLGGSAFMYLCVLNYL